MLVGREAEKGLVEGLIDGARSGHSGTVALVGEVGVGKSALLDHAASVAGDHVTVVRARGIQSEAHIPFAGLFELLRPLLGDLGRLADPQREALEAALALRPSGGHDRFAVGAATLSLLATVAEARPLLVLVDDAQWLDGSSADAVLFAVRRLVADRIAV
ncbi:MAG TPA: ATP-binding protein, partial [Acidimicrobiales bacterium]|nr:ATP-binding protein [Acidimicrobiales bacterium]